MPFLSEAAVEQALLDQLQAPGYGIERGKDISPDRWHPLPKPICGELRVCDMERFLEATI